MYAQWEYASEEGDDYSWEYESEEEEEQAAAGATPAKQSENTTKKESSDEEEDEEEEVEIDDIDLPDPFDTAPAPQIKLADVRR